jgi:hypothetical protein
MNTSKCMRFSDEVSSFNIPDEDRKGEWMIFAVDRCRFRTRIDRVSQVIEPVLRRCVEKVSIDTQFRFAHTVKPINSSHQ